MGAWSMYLIDSQTSREAEAQKQPKCGLLTEDKEQSVSNGFECYEPHKTNASSSFFLWVSSMLKKLRCRDVNENIIEIVV